MSPQRQDDKLIKIYEILPEGIQEIDQTETKGFNQIRFEGKKPTGEILQILDDIIREIQNLEIDQTKKENIVNKVYVIKNKLEI
jgi:hypothetical protein